MLLRRESFYRSSARVWTLVETGATTVSCRPISFNNVFYIARKHGGADPAYRSLQMIRSIFRPVEVDTRLLDEALAANGADFEDAVQLCCACRCDADYLVTRDHGGFRAAPVPIVTADELLTVLALDGPPADRLADDGDGRG